jgi:hypothetical protein
MATLQVYSISQTSSIKAYLAALSGISYLSVVVIKDEVFIVSG